MKDIGPPLNPQYKLSEYLPDQKFNFIHNPKCAGKSINHFIRSNELKECIYNMGHRFCDFSEEEKSGYPNQVVVIRNPVDRYLSSIRYLKRKKLLDEELFNIIEEENLCNSEFFTHILSGKSHKHREAVLSSTMLRNPIRKNFAEMSHLNPLSVNHELLPWVLVPQSRFVYYPVAVILFENLEKEFNYLLRKANIDVKFDVKVNVSRKNLMKPSENLLSEESIDFLENNFYKEDVEMYRHFSGLSIDERMNF